MTELSGNILGNNQDDFDEGIVSKENIDLYFNKLTNPVTTKFMKLIIGEFKELAKDSEIEITEGKCRYEGFVEKIIDASSVENSPKDNQFNWGRELTLDNKTDNVLTKDVNKIKIDYSNISCILTTNIPLSKSSSDVYKVLITDDGTVSVHEGAAYFNNTLYSNKLVKQEGSKAEEANVTEQIKFLKEKAVKYGLIKEHAANKPTIVCEHEKQLNGFFGYVDKHVVSTLKCLTSNSKVEISARKARFNLDENAHKNRFEMSVIIDTNIVNPTRDGNYTLEVNNSD
ncbi:MAG: hypothetical protein GY793_09110, partial [Proteobacteria bacterium]|nr:hypothetical protein [Pseudomonadota bacterium]